MDIEYKIAFTKPEWKYWGEFMQIFQNYSDAETELKKLMSENHFSIYRIIKITYEVVKEEVSK